MTASSLSATLPIHSTRKEPMNRFTTTIYHRAGEGATLYSGNNLGEAIRAARGVKTGRYETVVVTDWNYVDEDKTGAVDYWNFAESGEEFAIDVADYLTR